MAVLSLTDAFCYSAGYDFTTDTNSATLTTDVAQLDKTTFGSSGWTELTGGLQTSNLAWSGFWQVDGVSDQAVDNQAFSALGTSQVYTFGPEEVEGAVRVAYMFKAMKSQYTLGGQVGELMPFSLAATGSDGVGVVRGRVAKTRGTVSATGATGTGLQLGTVSADQSLYATFHVFSAGTSITVQLQSDDNSGFTTPTTVATIGPLTTSGGTWVTPIAGPLTDGYFRFNVSAITGSFVVAGAIGIA
jgi:hypothetical protein